MKDRGEEVQTTRVTAIHGLLADPFDLFETR
jgi:hypothetical protein